MNRIWQAIRQRVALGTTLGGATAGGTYVLDVSATLTFAATVLTFVLCVLWVWQAIEGIRAKRAARAALRDGDLGNDEAALREVFDKPETK